MTNEIKIVFSIQFRFVTSFCQHFYFISTDLFESVQKTKRIRFQYFLNIFFLRSVQASISFINNKDSFPCFNEIYTLFWRFFSIFNHRKMFCAINGTKIEKKIRNCHGMMWSLMCEKKIFYSIRDFSGRILFSSSDFRSGIDLYCDMIHRNLLKTLRDRMDR